MPATHRKQPGSTIRAVSSGGTMDCRGTTRNGRATKTPAATEEAGAGDGWGTLPDAGPDGGFPAAASPEMDPPALFVSLRGSGVVALALALGCVVEDAVGEQAGILANRQLDLLSDIDIVAQEGLGVLAALTEPLTVVGEPGA